jgi:hypothetical protein
MSIEQQQPKTAENTGDDSYGVKDIVDDLTRSFAEPGDFGYNSEELADNEFTAAGAVKNLNQLYSGDVETPRELETVLSRWNNHNKTWALRDMTKLLEEDENGLIESETRHWDLSGNGYVNEVTVYRVREL